MPKLQIRAFNIN